MLQDIGPGRYYNQFSSFHPNVEDYVLLYRGNSVYATVSAGMLRLPHLEELSPALRKLKFRYAFSIDQDRYFFADADSCYPGDSAPVSEGFVPSVEYRNLAPAEAAFACCVGESLHRWVRNNRYCGRCGCAMEDSAAERAFVCPRCGLTVYPKICPAVIVAVCDGDRLLLTKYKGGAFRRYALVAGFHEIGETIEETVHREVLEETGLRVKNLRFYKSQPWVLTDSLLLGFFCQLDGSDHITLQEDELSVGQWFLRNQIPSDYSGISLTGEMIELFRRGEDPYRQQELEQEDML